MTGLQMALLGGALIGLGFALLVWRLIPSDPDLRDVLEQFSASTVTQRRHQAAAQLDERVDGPTEQASVYDRAGRWAIATLPPTVFAKAPRKDLAILQITELRFAGHKVIWALMGLAIPPLFAGFFSLIGLGLPWSIPLLGSVACAAVFFFIPNYNIIDDAKKARLEFSRVLGAYLELVALERRAGASAQQALSDAAEVGDSWVFIRLQRELRRARFMSRAPWDSLRQLSNELGVTELDDLADIMQLSGQDGAQIVSNLRARSAALRSAMLSAEVAKANATAERMYIPASLVGIIFMAILVAPALLRFSS